jgi:hypothetical protein
METQETQELVQLLRQQTGQANQDMQTMVLLKVDTLLVVGQIHILDLHTTAEETTIIHQFLTHLLTMLQRLGIMMIIIK